MKVVTLNNIKSERLLACTLGNLKILDLKQKNAKPTTDYRQSYRHKQYFDGFSVTDLVVRITLKLEMLILSRPLSLGINPARH